MEKSSRNDLPGWKQRTEFCAALFVSGWRVSFIDVFIRFYFDVLKVPGMSSGSLFQKKGVATGTRLNDVKLNVLLRM
jgi:hypothetical protein